MEWIQKLAATRTTYSPKHPSLVEHHTLSKVGEIDLKATAAINVVVQDRV
jgi:hypothetical protein